MAGYIKISKRSLDEVVLENGVVWEPKKGDKVFVSKKVDSRQVCDICGLGWTSGMNKMDKDIQIVEKTHVTSQGIMCKLLNDETGCDYCMHWINKPTAEQMKPKEIVKSIDAYIERIDGRTFFKFEIDQRIEKLYKGIATEERTSESWLGLKFYYCPSITAEANYKNMLNNSSLIDDYGQGLFRNGYFNVAWLRTIGGKGSIELKGGVTMAEVSDSMTRAKRFIKEHWQGHFTNFKVRFTVNLEI